MADDSQSDVCALKEEPLQYGEGGQSMGILTLPITSPRHGKELPVFVLLNSGLLHRVGPRRLYVLLARGLSQLGFASLRIDLAGTGDSTKRSGLTHEQSVVTDFEQIMSILETRLGQVPIVLVGLCSGADNAIKLTLRQPRVVAMILLDPACWRDAGFTTRAMVRTATDLTAKLFNPMVPFRRRVKKILKGDWAREALKENRTEYDLLSQRESPTREQMREAFHLIRQRDGRVLSIFTNYALSYYNQKGQMDRVLSLGGYQKFCTELFWPDVQHTYPLEVHRLRLVKTIKSWASDYLAGS
jgi:pimeloyl-ACP methyl ester carboxylesterase